MQKVVPAQSRFIAAQLGKLSPVKQKQLLALLSELDRALAAE